MIDNNNDNNNNNNNVNYNNTFYMHFFKVINLFEKCDSSNRQYK